MYLNFIEISFHRIRDENSAILCPKDETLVIPDVTKLQFFECLNSLPKNFAPDLHSFQLKALTLREDIIFVDYDEDESLVNKLSKSNFLESLARSEPSYDYPYNEEK
jgi:hypothetical protein